MLLEHQAKREAGERSEHPDVLSLLLDNADSHLWGQDVLIDELVVFYLAVRGEDRHCSGRRSRLTLSPPQGFETTSSTLARVVQLLARHPEVLEKMVEEVLRVVGPEGSPVTMEHMDELKYVARQCA